MPTYKASEPKPAGVYLVPPGIYNVEVASATEKTSQSGNAMIKLVCTILLPDGSEGPEVWDHLVFTAKASWKIDQFLASIGRAVIPGEDVEIEALDIVGVKGVALIGEEPGATNPDHKFNCLERWVFGDERKGFLGGKSKPAAKKPAPAPATTKDEDDSDSIPF
jgi:hypothetical protein